VPTEDKCDDTKDRVYEEPQLKMLISASTIWKDYLETKFTDHNHIHEDTAKRLNP
jgi:hypothetical protein